MGKKYHLKWPSEREFTPSQVKRLGKDKQLEIMEVWFRTYFEDPAEETPYESREGGYQYIWGGPYDADEELQQEFSSLVPLDRIQELSEELGAENWQWAPTHNHPDRKDEGRDEREDERPPEPDLDSLVLQLEAGAEPKLGGKYELGLRKEIVDRVEALEEAVRNLASRRPAGIGHNRPPEDEDDDTISEKTKTELAETAAEIKAELNAPKPDALKVGKLAQTLKAIGGWLCKKLDKAVDVAITVAVTAGIVWATNHALWEKLLSVVNGTGQWLEAILSNF